jgi:hypothetical protein
MMIEFFNKIKFPLFWRGLGKVASGCALAMTMLLWPVVLSAQTGNGVKVENLVVNTGSPTTVTFDVSWKTADMPPVWSDTVWVFVDYNDNGVMKRLLLSEGATLTATSAPEIGRVKVEDNNNKGVWVVGDARSNSSFSATVQLLTATANLSGMCVYASNYPPVGVFTTETGITFTGTPMYDLLLEKAGGGTETVQSSNPFLVPDDYTVQSFTDKTGAPGIIITHAVYCDPGAIGDENTVLPRCTSYSAGLIGAEGYYPTDCARYGAGSIGGDVVE